MSAQVHWLFLAAGRVQGVNYRARVAEAARRYGLSGRAGNQADGTVLIDVQGPPEAVLAFVHDVSGPRGMSDAREVARMAELPIQTDLVGFEITRE